jgi:hypothetical protein
MRNLFDRSTPLNILHELWVESAFLRNTGVGSIRGMRYPFRGVTRSGLFHHAVNLFQGKSLGLINEEIGIEEAEKAERPPDEEDLGAKIALVGSHHVWGNDSDNLV